MLDIFVVIANVEVLVLTTFENDHEKLTVLNFK